MCNACPKASECSQGGGRYFAFDAHYPMSTLYHQTLSPFTMIPRLVGPNCPQHDGNEGEDYACWHSALFAVARCTGKERCCDPLLFKHLLTKDTAARRGHARRKHRFVPAWCAQLARYQPLAATARDKNKAARKIPCLADVSLLKEWFPEDHVREGTRPNAILRLSLLQLSFTHFNSWIPSIFRVLTDFLAVHPGFHKEQLHLEEYAALRVLEAVQNQNMQLLVAKKPFRTGQTDDVRDSADESDLEKDDGGFRKQEELFGGDGEDCDLTEDEEVFDTCAETCRVPLDLPDLQRLLSRRDEIDSAAARGRHRDMDVEMARYPNVFRETNDAPLPPIVANRGPGDGDETPMRDLPLDYHDRASMHQEAVMKILREQENDATDFGTAPPTEDFDPHKWDDIRAHNDALYEAECRAVRLDDLCLGPGHVAKKFIGSAPVRFNDEQIDCMALLIWDMDKAFRAQMTAEADAPVLPDAHVLVGGCADTPAALRVRQRCLLRNDLGLPRTLIVGGSGCGKTTMLLEVISPHL